MEEYFDVLNEKGEYTGKIETREKCHREGLWHKAVVVFIINSKGQVLLQKRSANKKMWPNTWDVTAGGHVLAGEFGFQSILRECEEELGIKLNKNDITFIGAGISTNIKGNIVNNHFICVILYLEASISTISPISTIFFLSKMLFEKSNVRLLILSPNSIIQTPNTLPRKTKLTGDLCSRRNQYNFCMEICCYGKIAE